VTTTQTLLAQTAAGSRTAVLDTFHTMDQIDSLQSSIDVDLEEGICTLPVNAGASLAYDGTRVQVVNVDKPAGTVEPGPPFAAVFNQYRLDAWYANLPALGGQVSVVVNVTGADYQAGASATVSLNALRITPAAPLAVTIMWSPDGLNPIPLAPAVQATITGRTTFNFAPITVGFLHFTFSYPSNQGEHALRQLRLGISRIELLQRGFTSSAQLFSTQYHFDEVVHTVVCNLTADLPFATRIVPYLSQGPAGPWAPIGPDAVLFDNRVWVETPIVQPVEEDETNPATFWQAPIDGTAQPLPGTGELIVGREQVQINAYAFDWRQKGERMHIPDELDWQVPLGNVRSGVFIPIGSLNAGTDPTAIGASGFTAAGSPLAVDVAGDSYLCLSLLQSNGQFVLQPGYNYQLSVAVWCPVPTTLDGQKIGVINPDAYGGVANTEVLPLSLFVNGEKRYQRTVAATRIDELSGAVYQTTLPLLQGWNTLELLLQVPADLVPGSNGLAAQDVYVYFQPNVFGTNREQQLGIRYVQAFRDDWPRVSEFDLRYNTPPGVRAAWAWKTDPETGIVLAVLFNYDPLNSRLRATPHPSFLTIDGTLNSFPLELLLRYPSERQIFESVAGGLSLDPRSLYFRADFFQDTGACAPSVNFNSSPRRRAAELPSRPGLGSPLDRLRDRTAGVGLRLPDRIATAAGEGRGGPRRSPPAARHRGAQR
jgi:hypothetical protein